MYYNFKYKINDRLANSCFERMGTGQKLYFKLKCDGKILTTEQNDFLVHLKEVDYDT
jgi:hypothetical protein